VKAGSILPMAPEMDSTDQLPADLLILDIYAGKAAKFRLYEDDGTSLEYRKQAFAWTPISYYTTSNQGQHVIKIEPVDGHYPGQPKARRYRFQVHGLIRPARVLMNGRPLAEKQMRGTAAPVASGVPRL
jgi:alpha-D-xyloside xylohydrolase